MDSSSAQGFIQRAGLGRTKHISVRMMYLQQLLRKQCFHLRRIPTKFNPSDLNTKKLRKDRRFLGKLIGLYQESVDQELESFRVHQVRALMNIASCMGLSISLKGCSTVTGSGVFGEICTLWPSLQLLYVYFIDFCGVLQLCGFEDWSAMHSSILGLRHLQDCVWT